MQQVAATLDVSADLARDLLDTHDGDAALAICAVLDGLHG